MASTRCTCIFLDQANPVVVDPSCSRHQEEQAVQITKTPKGFWQAIRDAIHPPERSTRAERAGWCVGIVLGLLFGCVVFGALAGLVLGLINWLRL